MVGSQSPKDAKRASAIHVFTVQESQNIDEADHNALTTTIWKFSSYVVF
jgi:hypothetical protein